MIKGRLYHGSFSFFHRWPGHQAKTVGIQINFHGEISPPRAVMIYFEEGRRFVAVVTLIASFSVCLLALKLMSGPTPGATAAPTLSL